MAEEALLVFSTFPSAEEAKEIARIIVTAEIAACANILPQMESIYRWKDTVETNTETLVLFKTTIGKYQALEDKLLSLHKYEIPEIIAIPLHTGLPTYLRWIEESCSK